MRNMKKVKSGNLTGKGSYLLGSFASAQMYESGFLKEMIGAVTTANCHRR